MIICEKCGGNFSPTIYPLHYQRCESIPAKINSFPKLRIDAKHKDFSERTTGVMSYYEDFEKIIVPLFKEKFNIITEGPADVVLNFHNGKSGYSNRKNNYSSIRILHSPKQAQSLYQKEVQPGVKYITHYKQYSNENFIFIPMSIDIESLPKTETKKGIIYYGNITDEKEPIFNQLKKSNVKFDVLSFSKFNDSNKVLSQSECLEIVSGYEYGIGVGRCALEMLTMGLKVIVAGRNYSGAITNENILEHLSSNCNSDVLVSDAMNFENDMLLAEKIHDCSLFDMRNYAKDYLSILEKSVEERE